VHRTTRQSVIALMMIYSVGCSTSAFADSCTDLVNDSNAKNDAESNQLQAAINKSKSLEGTDGWDQQNCEVRRLDTSISRASLQRIKQAEQACGTRLKTQCNSDCQNNALQLNRKLEAQACSAGSAAPISGGTTNPGSSSPDRSNLMNCISSTRGNMSIGYIPWTVKNSCDFRITFDYDDCNPGPSYEVSCEMKTDYIPPHGEQGGSNYHNPANARNYR
jgi:hypothetical protein